MTKQKENNRIKRVQKQKIAKKKRDKIRRVVRAAQYNK